MPAGSVAVATPLVGGDAPGRTHALLSGYSLFYIVGTQWAPTTIDWSSLNNFFLNAHLTPIWCIFNADYDELIEIYIFPKKSPPPPTFVLKNSMARQKTKCENNIKWVFRRSKMMAGFQIWPQSSIWITFNPLFIQRTVENWQHLI